MPVWGQGRKGILVVGEAPGQTEDEENRPFIGKAGQHLRKTLGALGVRLDRDCLVTNSLICRPPKNRTPDIKEIGYCRPNLTNLIKQFEPKVIITLGRSALLSVLEGYWNVNDVGPLERWVGWKIPAEKHWICPTYHPSYLERMQNPLLERIFSDHLEAAFEIDRLPPKQQDWESKIQVLFNNKDICAAVRLIHSDGGWVAVDYETNCLKPEWEEAKIVSCALSNGHRTISYPWMGDAPAITGELLRSKHTKKIASNLKMEERWTKKSFGHGVNNWGWDTMLASHCLDNRQGICSLKFQALVKMGVPIGAYNEVISPYLEDSRGHYNRFHEIDLKQLLLYGGMDTLFEYHLAMQQREEMGYED